MLDPFLDRRVVCPSQPASPDVAGLIELAASGILPMFDSERQLFCHRLQSSESGLVREGVSRRYTMMVLIGLQRGLGAGMPSPVDIREVLESMLRDTAWVDNIGDLGLLLWACASIWPERLSDVRYRLELGTALAGYREGRERRSMELAWFLTGLTYAAAAQPDCASGLESIAFEAYRLVKANQGGHGLFGHMARNKGAAGLLRGHIGSFADQVYPIYALAAFGKAYREPAAVKGARDCAEAICRAQGPLGQWWWHYDARDGQVFEKYPVYSVHQHGMAPMALFALEEAGGGDFTGPIYRGLRWIIGDNELTQDLRDSSARLIWRSIYPAHRRNAYFARVGRLVGLEERKPRAGDLKVTFECRPYELGWLLYALAGRAQRSHSTADHSA